MTHDPPPIESPEGPRVTIGGRTVDWFRSSSYLGLQADPRVLRDAVEATERFGMKLRDRRAIGMHPVVAAWEEAGRAFFGADEAVLLGSGYAGGLVMSAALGDRFDVAFVDAEAHANIADGLRGCGRTIVPFAHRDADDLRRRLASDLPAGARPLVVTDGVFPITGDPAPLPDYADVLASYPGATLLVDDAHGFGVMGARGRGTLEHFGLEGDGRMAYGTMSKAFGAAGGIVPCTEDVRARIESRSAAFAGTTKPPPGVVAAGARALAIARAEPERRARLRSLVARVRAGLAEMGIGTGDSSAPIVCIRAADGFDAAGVAARLLREDAIAVLHASSGYANVPAGGALVFTLSATHDDAQVERLLDALRRAA